MDSVLKTLLCDSRPSTKRVYSYTWEKFSEWCKSHHISSSNPRVMGLLEFLQSGLDKGLSTATLKRQFAVISSILGFPICRALSIHPHVRMFLRGVVLLNPLVVHCVPSWDLPLVLKALSRLLFEPMATCSLLLLTFKTVFMVGITSTRRVSEMAALSVAKDFLECKFSNECWI